MKTRALLTVLALIGVLSAPCAAKVATTTAAAGTKLNAMMNQTLDSGTAYVGEDFTMQLVAPYPNGDAGTWSGSTVHAHVVNVQHASQGRKAVLEFLFDKITLRDGASAAMHATLVSVDEKHGSNVGHTALTALGGMVVGNVLGKWMGTNAGGAVGLTAGALYGVNKKTNFSIGAGSTVVFQLSQSLTVVRP
jgi:hypothetical protein